MNEFKRFFALILTLCMVLSYVPVGASAEETGTISLSGTPTTPAGVSGNTEPFPLSVFSTYDDEDDTKTGHFRIPVMLTLENGDLVAAADVRWHNYNPTPDDNGNIDTIVSRSTDNGMSWTYSFANYFGGTNPYGENYGVPTYIDPGLGYDGDKLYMIVDLYPGQNGDQQCTSYSSSNTGYDNHGRMLLCANSTINGHGNAAVNAGYYLDKYNDGSNKTYYKIYTTEGAVQDQYIVDAYFNLYTKNDQDTYVFTRNLFEYSTDSFSPVFTSHLYLTTSEDGGKTWSEPTMINPSVRPGNGEVCYLVNPGRGLYTKDDVMVFAGYTYSTQRANLMFSTDGGDTWNTTGFAGSESSECELVELSDGTIRMFVRHNANGNYVRYFDWTPIKDANGNVTNYTVGNAVDTTAVAHNNTNITAIVHSRTIGGKQVIMVSAPGDTSSAWTRLNGKIFTFVVDPDTKAMTLINSFEVNGASDSYSYSSMTELKDADGTVGLLYEKGDSGNITYAEFDPEIVAGAELDGTYDIFVMGSSNLQGEIRVKRTHGVTHIHAQANTNVAGVTGDYVAYDVALCKDAETDCSGINCTNVHAGEAKVVVPVPSEMAAKELKGFVVNSDGSLSYVNDVTVSNVEGVYLATFKAPHFSTVGVMPKTNEELATAEKNVTVKVGATYVGNLQSEANLNGNNAGHASAAKANVSWSSVVAEAVATAKLGSDASFSGSEIDLTNCLYTFTKNADDTWVVSAQVGDATVYVDPHYQNNGNNAPGYPNRPDATNITIAAPEGYTGATDGPFTFTDSTGSLHFHSSGSSNQYRWNQCGSAHKDSGAGTHGLWIFKADPNATNSGIPGYAAVTTLTDLVNGEYLIAAKGSDGNFYLLNPVVNTSNYYAHVAKVTGNVEAQYATTVTIEGVAEGTTEIAIGQTLYKITVAGEVATVPVNLRVGQSTTLTDDTGYYVPTYTGKGLDESVATVAVNGTTVDHAQDVADTAATAIQSGKQYMIVCKRSVTDGHAAHDPENSVLSNDMNGAYLHMVGPMADDLNEYWTITQVNGGYTVQDADGKYLTFGNDGDKTTVSTTETVLTLNYNSNGYWRISNNGRWLSDVGGTGSEDAKAYNQENDDGNNWLLYEVTPAYTEGTTGIQITGVSVGTTSVVVGNTRYEITVAAAVEKAVTVKVGHDHTETQDGYVQPGSNAGTEGAAYANISWVSVATVATGTNQNFNVAEVDLSACEYLFYEKGTSGSNTTFRVKGVAPDNTEVWAYFGGNAGFPHATSRATVTFTAGTQSGTYKLNAAGLLHFGDNGSYPLTWNKCSSDHTSESDAMYRDHDMLLFRPANANETESQIIPGYVQITDISAVENNTKVLIVHEENGEYYVMRPSKSTTDRYAHVGKLNDATTTVTFTGVSAGTTSVMVGDVKYNVNVKIDATEVELTVGERQTFVIDGVAHTSGTVVDPSKVDMVVTPVQGGTVDTSGTVTSIVSGSRYVIAVNNRTAGNNATHNVLTYGANDGGLDINGVIENTTVFWTIEANDDGTYYVKTDAGRYLTIGNGSAGTSETATKLTLAYNDGYWMLGQSGQYLNQYGGAGTDKAAGYNDPTDTGSRWHLFLVNETHTEVTFTGKAIGETLATVGGVNYAITVVGLEKDVELNVDQTVRITDTTGNYTDRVDRTDLDEDVATVTVTGADGDVTYIRGEEITSAADLTTGKYLIVSVSAGKYLTNASTDNRLQFATAIDSSAIWTITASDNGYYIQDSDENYLYVGDNTAGVGDVNEIVLDHGTNWRIKEYNTEIYLNDHQNGHSVAGGWPDATNRTEDVLRWKIFRVVENVVPSSTTIEITGVSEGETSIVVGNTTYNIHVEKSEQDVNLYVGQSVTITDETGNYENNVNRDNLDESIAQVVVTSNSNVLSYRVGDAVSTLESGKQYAIVNVRAATSGSGAHDPENSVLTDDMDGDSLHMNGPLTDDTTEIWTITKVDGVDNGYTIQQGGKYLTFTNSSENVTTSATPTTLTVAYTAGSGWKISNGNAYLSDKYGANNSHAFAYNDANDGGNYWYIYEMVADEVEYSTDITFTGVAAGDTSVTVGGTVYNIHVLAETVNVTLFAGQSKDFTINGAAYTAEDVVTQPNADIATITSITTSDATYILGDEVTAQADLTTGTYIIVSNSGNKTMTNVTQTNNNKAVLAFGGTKDNFTNASVWTITKVSEDNNELFYVQDAAGKYLNLSAGEASISDQKQQLSVWRRNTGCWTLRKNGEWTYLSDSGNAHNIVDAWNSESAYENVGCQWSIYKVERVSAQTHLTINGVAKGNTVARVGHVTYNIQVIEEIVDVELVRGEDKTFILEDVVYTSGTIDNADIATLTVTGVAAGTDSRLVPVTTLRDVGRYVLVCNRPQSIGGTAAADPNHAVLTDEPKGGGLFMTSLTDDTQEIWIITKYGDGCTIQNQEGKYLTFSDGSAQLTNDKTMLTLTYETGSGFRNGWLIQKGNNYLSDHGGTAKDYALGIGTKDDDGNYWTIYEATGYTLVNIAGDNNGTAVAKVGHVTYNITVRSPFVKVELFVGETWEGVIDDTGITGEYEDKSVANVTWKGINDGVLGHLMTADGTDGALYSPADAELTFTRNDDGTFTMVDNQGNYMTIFNQPYGITANHNPQIAFNEDGTAKIFYTYTSGGQEYTNYLRYNTGYHVWQYNADVTTANSVFDFSIYTPVTDPADSSQEIAGYKQITSLDQIVSGESYLIAFQMNGDYYCMTYNPVSGDGYYGHLLHMYPTTHTDITIEGKHVGSTIVTINGVEYDITVKPFEKIFSMEINTTESFRAHEGITQAQIDAFNAANSNVVTAALVDGRVVFTAVAEGTVTEFLLGDNLYTINVTPDLADADDTNYIGGQEGTKGYEQKVTGLVISNNTSYDLNLDDTVTGTITWQSSDENLFTIDENGLVTSGANGGEGYVTVYVDGAVHQTIPVRVVETVKAANNSGNRLIDVYNAEVLNCTAYYSYNNLDLYEFPKGYQIYVRHTKSETDLITFYATPDEGYALTYINGDGGTFYHTVTTPDGLSYCTDGTHSDSLNMKTGGYHSLHDQLIAYVVNNSYSAAADVDTVHQLLENAVVHQIDGAFFFSRGARDGEGNIATNTTFVAEKLPEVDKSVNGILGTSGLQIDFKTYTDGMYAEVGQHIYFTLEIELEAPLYWERALNSSNAAYKPATDGMTLVEKKGYNILTDADGNVVAYVDYDGYAIKLDADGNPLAALEYNTDGGMAKLTDNMQDAYFYTKEQDLDDDVNGDGIFYEGFLAEDEQSNYQDVTAALNRGWTDEEMAAGKRVLQYFVVYKIKNTDVDHEIVNTVSLDYTYTTTYSYGYDKAHSDAQAAMTVLGKALGDVVVDFGMPFVKTGLTTDDLPGVTADNLATVNANIAAAQGGCKYGTAVISVGENGTFTLTYTPTTVLVNYDVIYIMDANNNLINYIRVRPASTVYYEETFAELGNATSGTNGWTLDDEDAVNGTQEYEDVGCTKHDHSNFGYDATYSAQTGMSNGSQLTSSKSGDTATFTFNGTGFDVYANCDPETSVVAVLVYRLRGTTDAEGNAILQEELTKFFQVSTKTKAGSTGATANQDAVNADALPIVSITDLEHGTYKVVIRHTKRTDGSDAALFNLDGFRIYNTLTDGDQYYPANERNVTFTELRDEVLYAAGVTADSSQTYNQGAGIVDGTASGATVAFLRAEDKTETTETGDETTGEEEEVTTDDMLKDWLDNAPKNEIWMAANDSLVFTLAADIANAQIGLKAPTGNAKVTITLSNGDTLVATKDYVITTATDMFYELPEVDDVSGLTVIVTATEGLLSVTKLKTNVVDPYAAVFAPLAVMDDLQVASALSRIYAVNDDETTEPSDPDDGTTTDPSNPDDGETTDPSDPDDGTTTDPSNPDDGETTDPSDPSDDDLPDAGVDVYKDTVNRIFGENRFETAFKVADELKAVLGIEKFKNIIIASGTNFADALSGTYLASVKNAPILLSYNEVYNDMVREYIAENLAEDGTVYILGGNAAVPYTMDLELIADGITIKRLAGADRFATNLAILTEAGVKGGEILVCTGSNFADSLSASATGKPILLVYNESGELSVAQKLYLTMMDRANFTIIGGEKAISAELEEAVSAYGVTNRLAGANRFETSVAIAEAYFTDPQDLVLAYAGNYPDGLCGGALAYAINAPLVLTMSGYETEADDYADAFDVQGGVVLGGSGLISDDSVVEIFGLEKPEEIIVK